jgi:hypothetical protein
MSKGTGRLAVVFVAGLLVGVAGTGLGSRWLEVHLMKAEQGRHQLTADIAPESLYAFRDGLTSPLIGTIKAGSEYRVEARKGLSPTSPSGRLSIPMSWLKSAVL